MTALALQLLPTGQLHESPLNPRKHYDQAALEQLADSLRKAGVLNALTARPRKVGGGYELAAGHRRLRAAKLAKIAEVPVNVREMDDATFLEVMTIDNLQRDDLHPLEEAQGFRSLMEKSIGYDVAKIADRVGRSAGYVYDRLRLLQLIPKAQDLFLEKRFTLAHAVLLSRLNAEQQEKAMEPGGNDGLFRIEHTRQFELEGEDITDDDWAGTKPCSVREFEDWIDRHVRLDLDAEDIPQLFPTLDKQLALADTSAVKVVEISFDTQVHPDAKTGSRTVGPMSWRRAEKPCDHQALGVVVAGIRRGESFMICTNKKKCTVHWGDEIRQRAQLERQAAGAGAAGKDAQAEHRRLAAETRRRQEEEQAQWKKAIPAMLKAIAAALAKAPAGPTSEVAKLVRSDEWREKQWGKLLPAPKTEADVLRRLAFFEVADNVDSTFVGPGRGAALAKRFGVDLKAILKASVKEAAAPAKKPAKATPAKKKGAK